MECKTIIGVIPARMSSSRFPGKPLVKIRGIPMVKHVYLRSKMCTSLSRVFVATCDKKIYQYIKSIGGDVVMTSASHKRASDRAAQAMMKIEKKISKRIDILVMIQGDEPMLYPEMIDASLKPLLRDKKIMVTNLMSPLRSTEEYHDPHEIKVVVDKEGFALYFSREPIPSRKKWPTAIPMFKQVCIIPFRRDFLLKFNRLKPTTLEQVESIDMLRILEHGLKVKMVLTDYLTYSVDTPQDLEKVEKLMSNDKLIKQYPGSII